MVEYNFGTRDRLASIDPDGSVVQVAKSAGTDAATWVQEAPGMSAFALADGVVYHTYSTYARGLDGLWGAY